ncbi:MAG: lysophospholipid acyltransferase family protein [Chloroflexota bacterium]
MTEPARAALPGPEVSPWRRTVRYWMSRIVVSILTRGYLRVRRVDGPALPAGPAIYCFNHMSWADPFVLMALLPYRPRLWFFGPKEEDMGVGGRNRVMTWTGSAIPYKPGKNDLLEATRRVGAVIASGGVVAIAGEGRIHGRENEILPLSEGAAYFAMRSRVPLVPIAIHGTSWLRFGGHVSVAVGEAIRLEGRPNRASLGEATDRLTAALTALVADSPEVKRPGRIGRWLTERFNDWPEGSRAAALAASGSVGPAAGESSGILPSPD